MRASVRVRARVTVRMTVRGRVRWRVRVRSRVRVRETTHALDTTQADNACIGHLAMKQQTFEFDHVSFKRTLTILVKKRP